MELKVALGYVAWWVRFHPQDIGMEEDDYDEEEVSNEGSS